jgi:signal transduction histidine kinase
MRKTSLGVLIAALGWLINLPYWVNELLVKGYSVLGPSREVLLEHVLVASTIPVFMAVGYLFHRQARMEEKLREYSEFLAQKVEERTRELREANQKLRATYEELRELSDLKDALLANVSHELRTPITIAKGAIDLAKEEKDPLRRRKLLNMAMDALERQNRIVGDLIAYQEEKKPGSGEVADIARVVEMAAGMFRRTAEKRRINIIVKPVENRLPLVRGDPEKILHVLGNLLDNAIKFNREGGEIRVEAARKNGQVEVCVSDTGVGIPRDRLSRVFDRFYQVDSSLTRRYGGTGMGLAVAREIVEGFGGRIWAESEEGKGSRFCFTLPVVEGG